MKKLIMYFIVTLLLVGCKSKTNNITFEAVVETVSDASLMVNALNYEGLDKVSVSITDKTVIIDSTGKKITLGNIYEQDKLKVTILPEIRESYPPQTTAVKIELLEREDIEQVKNKSEYKKITAEQAKTLMDNEEVIILDVRTLEEYKDSRIDKSILIPDYEIEEIAPMKLVDKDAKILVYCRSGRRSKEAAIKLVDMGYTNVYDFGGIIDWPYETISGE